jgi:hypothetical protein
VITRIQLRKGEGVRKSELREFKRNRMLGLVRSSFARIPSPDRRIHIVAGSDRLLIDLSGM